jgi:hypothetical protein
MIARTELHVWPSVENAIALVAARGCLRISCALRHQQEWCVMNTIFRSATVNL